MHDYITFFPPFGNSCLYLCNIPCLKVTYCVFYLCDILEKTKFQGGEQIGICQGLGLAVVTNNSLGSFLGGDGTILKPDHYGGCTNLYMCTIS